MLDAREAGRLTDAALGEDAEAVRPYLEYVEAKVRMTVMGGRRSLLNPFAGVPSMPEPPSFPTAEVRDAVRKVLEAKGYKWEDHGRPNIGSYTTVSW